MDIPWNVPRSHGTVGWDGQYDTCICRATGGHPVESPMGLWDGMDNPMGPWDGMDNLRHFWTALV